MTIVQIRTKRHRTSGRDDEKLGVRHKQTIFSSLWMPLAMCFEVTYSFVTVTSMFDVLGRTWKFEVGLQIRTPDVDVRSSRPKMELRTRTSNFAVRCSGPNMELPTQASMFNNLPLTTHTCRPFSCHTFFHFMCFFFFFSSTPNFETRLQSSKFEVRKSNISRSSKQHLFVTELQDEFSWPIQKPN